MSSDELSLFSYEVLGLVGAAGRAARSPRHGAAGPDPRLGRGEPVLRRAEAARRLGYLEARKEPGRTRDRTVYTLTDKGRQALRDWAATPVLFTPLKSEPLVRLLIADLVGEEVTRGSLGTLRADIADLSVCLAETEARAASLPHRRKYLLLASISCAACCSSTCSSSRTSNASWPRHRTRRKTAAGRRGPDGGTSHAPSRAHLGNRRSAPTRGSACRRSRRRTAAVAAIAGRPPP